MNKKEIAELRREMKEDSIKLNIKDIYSIYLKKDNSAIIHREFDYFERLDTEKRELYFNNFKKVLSGAIDTKTFELEFKNINENHDNNTQEILFQALKSENKEQYISNLDKMLNKISSNYKYDTDSMITFIRAEYFKGSNKSGKDYDEAIDDKGDLFNFILCTINKIDFPKCTLKFDYASQEFCASTLGDAVVNLNSPMDGFMFPVFENGYSNVNKTMYYSSKAKEMNENFVEEVLDCTTKFTAEDEKECFHSILGSVIGEKIKPDLIQEIYTKINEETSKCDEEDEEIETIGINEIKHILEETSVEGVEQLEKAFEESCGTNYCFKVNNIVPQINSKSIKISSENADIIITPRDLSNIKQIRNKEGKKCLMIELDDDVIINGLKLETEEYI